MPALRRTPKATKLWLIGNSLSAGYDAGSRDASFAALLRVMLERSAGSSVSILNRNDFGGQASDGLAQAAGNIGFAGDAVVVQFGENDLPLSEAFQEPYTALLDLLKDNLPNARLVLCTVWNPGGTEQGEQASAWIRRTAPEHGASVCELGALSLYQGVIEADRDVGWLADVEHPVSDAFHPNDKGHTLIANELFGLLADVFGKRLDRRKAAVRAAAASRRERGAEA